MFACRWPFTIFLGTGASEQNAKQTLYASVLILHPCVIHGSVWLLPLSSRIELYAEDSSSMAFNRQ